MKKPVAMATDKCSAWKLHHSRVYGRAKSEYKRSVAKAGKPYSIVEQKAFCARECKNAKDELF